MESVHDFVIASLLRGGDTSDEERGKVTLRLDTAVLGRLDSVATQLGKTRTRTAEGLLEGAISQAVALLNTREQEPDRFAEQVYHWQEDDRERTMREFTGREQ